MTSGVSFPFVSTSWPVTETCENEPSLLVKDEGKGKVTGVSIRVLITPSVRTGTTLPSSVNLGTVPGTRRTEVVGH